jgi:peptide/nickel transport system permease protein
VSTRYACGSSGGLREGIGDGAVEPAECGAAAGLGEPRVLILHSLKNASVPIVTTIGTGLALLIGGVVVTESVFAVPGIGRLTIDAVLQRDYPVIQGVILVVAGVYVLVNLLIDLTYSLLDPRIRY